MSFSTPCSGSSRCRSSRASESAMAARSASSRRSAASRGATFEFHAQFVHAGQLFATGGDAVRQQEALRAGARGDGAAGALAALDQSLRAQSLGDFADHGGADAVLFGQHAAGRQFGADGMHALGDIGGDLAGDLFGQGQGRRQHAAIIGILLRLSDNFSWQRPIFPANERRPRRRSPGGGERCPGRSLPYSCPILALSWPYFGPIPRPASGRHDVAFLLRGVVLERSGDGATAAALRLGPIQGGVGRVQRGLGVAVVARDDADADGQPTLTRVPSASAIGCETSCSRCSPSRNAAGASMPVTSTMNSSPPMRAATSSTRSMRACGRRWS